MLWILGACILLFLSYRAIHSEKDDARYFFILECRGRTAEAEAEGIVERIQEKAGRDGAARAEISLKKCRVQTGGHKYTVRRLLVMCESADMVRRKEERREDDAPEAAEGEKSDIRPGDRLYLKGDLSEFPEATNPGQFDRRVYYREKGIIYQFSAERIEVTEWGESSLSAALYSLREKIRCVYERCLPQKEAGIVSAMILGDKSLLDIGIRDLYQENGIGHLLAISGLHVTILGMAFWGLLRMMGIPIVFSVPVSICVLLAYGELTGFSISTSRAVLMMILLLASRLAGRTYDRRSALAFSALVILLQNPFALFSCSFLLSFGTVAGMEILLPAANALVYGGEAYQREQKRRRRQWERESRAKGWSGSLHVWLAERKSALFSMFLISLSVQLMTLPILLYFYYEIPIYGIILNLLVLPPASLVVLLAFLGGAAGCIFLPVGRLLLGSVYWLLRLYEMLCRLFQRFPGYIQILGRPAGWKIAVYYLFLLAGAAVIIFLYRRREHQKPFAAAFMILIFPCLLFVPHPAKEFQMTMLDVGQGECIYIHSPSGGDYLVDGGSTSVSKVGEYRILPFLKSRGVRRLNGIFMTHSDEDHMNGLLEVIGQAGRGGICVDRLLLPDIAAVAERDIKIRTAAAKKGIPVVLLSDGMCWQEGQMRLICLNPVRGFDSEDINAGSVTLSLRHGDFFCLLTGDLQGEGEEHVRELLSRRRKYYGLPERYTVLKTAHHGSKNSSDEEFLRLVSARMALISCGRDNRYGHPHSELLERLTTSGYQILRTDQSGAVSLSLQGTRLTVDEYCAAKNK